MTKRNRYSGKCHECEVHVVAGEGTLTKVGRRWAVWCGFHAPNAPAAAPGKSYGERVTAPRGDGIHRAYFPSTGGHWTQNARGRCEDAPCCGCCS